MPTSRPPALSIKQPWASAIVAGSKDVENRTWRANYRGPLLIHAGVRDSLEGWRWMDERGLPLPVDPPTGGIIGIVELVDCVRDYPSQWATDGHWHWVLADARPLPFRAAKGQLGIWRL